MNPGPSEEAGKAVNAFMHIMREQPLSLALVVSNLLLLIFVFYSNASILSQRRETAEMIVGWQRETDKLMASCVSSDVMKMVLDALERDREAYRRLLPQQPLEHPPIPIPRPQSQHILFHLPP